MSKFVATLFAAACILGFAVTPAQATPSGCAVTVPDPNQPGFDLQTCDLDESVDGDFIQVSNAFGADDWFDSWVILDEPGGASISDVLHFDSAAGVLTLWSDGSAGFAAAIASASAPGVDLFRMQENVVPGAATTFYVSYTSSITVGGGFPSGAFDGCGAANSSGSCDTINVFSLEENGNPNPEVPEPATLTLLGVGSAVAAYRRRKAGRTV